MQSQRWAWTHRYGWPLLLASVVSVLLAGGGLVAVVAFGGDNDGGGDGGRTDPSASPVLGTDPDCVVGRWQIVEQRQVLSSGVLTLADDGPVVEYGADGAGWTDFGAGVRYALTDTLFGGLGDTDTMVTGIVHHEYVVGDSTMQYVDIRSEATMTIEVVGELPYELSNEPFQYTCGGDTLTHQIEERYQARLQRLDP